MAQTLPALDTQLREEVVLLPGAPDRPVELQVTLFKPEGPGPFPLAVLNHGLNRGKTRDRDRWRAPYATRYFLSRGYMVALPMMRGFAGSGGEFDTRGCDMKADGLNKAADLRGMIVALGQMKDVDATRVVVLGQSYGGFSTIAFGAVDPPPGVMALINFAGGVRSQNCVGFVERLIATMGFYGHRTSLPSLWVYGDNDKTFPTGVWRKMYEAYLAEGGNATLDAFGEFSTDAHFYLTAPQGLQSWAPALDAFLSSLGLPTAVAHPEVLPMAYPSKVPGRDVNDVEAVPYISESKRVFYRRFLDAPPEGRAVVISPDGGIYYAYGLYDPLAVALKNCGRRHADCTAYAIDSDVVWRGP